MTNTVIDKAHKKLNTTEVINCETWQVLSNTAAVLVGVTNTNHGTDVDNEISTNSMRSQTVVRQETNKPIDHMRLAIVNLDSEATATVPIVCASTTGSPMHIQLNIPLISPNEVLHDIITHNELPMEVHHALVEK